MINWLPLTNKNYNKWFLISLSNESKAEDYNYFNVTKFNSMKFLQNSSNMNLKTTKQKYFNTIFNGYRSNNKTKYIYKKLALIYKVDYN
ncbi:hypothetical protein H8356DRAFT_1333723 [Neocallimastix lanati (nom. inval.)]|nr:hypothetical protein H8356DRAFT_1333723 [Neocallimastix sp. JGI-2020a]